jgi:hypothetical protein
MDSSRFANFFVRALGVTARAYPASTWVPLHPSHDGICALAPERPSDLIFFKIEGLFNRLVIQAPYQLTGEYILEPCDIEPVLAGSNIRNVCHPGFVWALRSEHLVQQVANERQVAIRIRRLEFPLPTWEPSVCRGGGAITAFGGFNPCGHSAQSNGDLFLFFAQRQALQQKQLYSFFTNLWRACSWFRHMCSCW